MKRAVTHLVAGTLLAMSAAIVPLAVSGTAHAAEIAYIVNKNAVTTFDIKNRAAFLRLQRRPSSTQAATDEMIDQVLKEWEAKRVGVSIPKKEVDAAYARFAKSNNLSTAQLAQALGQAGVSVEHFKDYIRSQMAWGQAVARKYRSQPSLSHQELVERMLQTKDNKPTATEYQLQQVIFVVPETERKSKLNQRVKEANALRARFAGCDATREIAKGLLDVTVRDLGRVLDPELPPEWAQFVREAGVGQPTKVRETEKGAEFLAVCATKSVSDDRVAELTFRAEQTGEGGEKFADEYLAEIRAAATIVKR